MFHDKVDDDGDSIRGDSRSMLFGHCFGDLLILNANDKNMFTETLFKHSTLVTTFYTDVKVSLSNEGNFFLNMFDTVGSLSCPGGFITCRPPILDSCSSSSSSFLFMLIIIIIIAILLMMIILWQSGGRTKCLCNKHPHQLLPPR